MKKYFIYISLCILLGAVLGVSMTVFSWQFWVVDILGVLLIYYFVIIRKPEEKEKKEPLIRGIDYE